MSKKVILKGFGMSVPQLGGAYTLTIQEITIENESSNGSKHLDDNSKGREEQAILLNRELKYHPLDSKTAHRFSFTFSKVTSVRDTGTLNSKGIIEIKGISPQINGMYVQAEISYPNPYLPPIIV